MESLFILIALCGSIFFMFAFSEVVKLKKEVKKLNGIVDYLLKQSNPKDNSAE
tara:strand:+ start:404 stop:562 length:159 start_codon:yes stop_codon:yes gene_type:complete